MSKTIIESIFPGLKYMYGLKTVLDSDQSPFQTVDFVDTAPFGKALLLDGLMQSAEADEFVYHECLVQPALLLHPNPERVFIGGGGEGSTAREVLRHKSVKECIMVDIDPVCVDFCKKHLTNNAEAFADPRLNLIIDDCHKQLMLQEDASLDIIILDLDDPLPGGPCFDLYTTEFYELCRKKLKADGIFVSQTAAAGTLSHKFVFSPVINTLKKVFPDVKPYKQHVFSFGDTWGWAMGLNSPAALPTADEIDKRIEARITGGAAVLKHLDGALMLSVFVLPKDIALSINNETRILTKADPAIFAVGLEGHNTADLGH